MLSVGTFDEGTFDTCDRWVIFFLSLAASKVCKHQWPLQVFQQQWIFFLTLRAHLQFDVDFTGDDINVL